MLEEVIMYAISKSHTFYCISAKAIYDNKLLECYFTRSFYKHILGILVKYTDMESEDYAFYKGLVYLMENKVDTLGYEITFSTEVTTIILKLVFWNNIISNKYIQ